MAIQLQPVKGFRDLYPQDKALQNYVFDKLKEVASLYGFENYDGPILEPVELYLGKTSEELIERQTFQLKDKKGETLVMRPEMTPSLARMVAQQANQLTFPLRLFNLGLRYRYETPQKRRVREFYQGDFDIIGSENILADAEILALAISLFKSLGGKKGDFKLYVNSREIMEKYLLGLGYSKEQIKPLYYEIDRQDKISDEEFIKRLRDIDPDETKAKKLINFLYTKNFEEFPYFIALEKILKEYGLQYGNDENSDWEINYNITRGLDYYTGIVFEIKEFFKDEKSKLKTRSLLGGGRYDNLVSSYNPNLKIPGVGFATSDVSLLDFIKDKNLIPQINPKSTKYLVTVFSQETLKDSIRIVNKLREKNISAEIYPDSDKKLDKQLKYADRNNIPYAIIAGPEEIQKGVVKVKDMKTGEQKEVNISDL